MLFPFKNLINKVFNFVLQVPNLLPTTLVQDKSHLHLQFSNIVTGSGHETPATPPWTR